MGIRADMVDQYGTVDGRSGRTAEGRSWRPAGVSRRAARRRQNDIDTALLV
jgi:hypothetical protein